MAQTKPEVIHLTDDSTRAEIERAVTALRAKAVRWSRSDPRRAEVDAECDELVTMWLAASS